MEQYNESTQPQDNTLTLTQGSDHTTQYIIKRINIDTPYRTLGIYITASGEQTKQFKILLQHSNTWKRQMDTSTLSDLEKITAYQMFILPKLTYPLPYTLLSKEELTRIQRPALKVILQALHLNSTFPLSIIHGDKRYQGLEIDNLYVTQGATQIKYYIGHTRMNDTTGKLMRIEKDYVELLNGLGKCPLQNPATTSVAWCPRSWITHVGKFLNHSEASITSSTPRVIKHQRNRDIFLMSMVGHLGKAEQLRVQNC